MSIPEYFSRSAMLLGEEAIATLGRKKVAVFGVGGVGGYVVEALARTGVGEFVLVDHDVISPSNINRQIIATTKTIGQKKVEVMKNRILEIHPSAKVTVYPHFFLPETAQDFDFSEYDYVVDAVDTVTAKLQILRQARLSAVPVISSMGTGNKLDPTKFQIADIAKTSVCPLARVMRYECRKQGITGVKVLFSTETPVQPQQLEQSESGKPIPGSVAFVPSIAGLMIAGEVLKDLIRV